MTRLLDTLFVVLFGAVLAAAAVFLVVPIGMTVLMSFDGREYLGRFPPPVLSLRWYTAFFFDSYYMVALRNSAMVATVAATMATATGVTAAVLLDRYRFRGREVLSAFFLSPLVVPTVVMGFSVLMFLSLLGLYDGFVRLIAGHIVITLPYTIRTTLASLDGHDRLVFHGNRLTDVERRNRVGHAIAELEVLLLLLRRGAPGQHARPRE